MERSSRRRRGGRPAPGGINQLTALRSLRLWGGGVKLERMAANQQQLVAAMLDFSSGVNSNVVPMLESDGIPHGLKPSMVPWANNCTMRNGALQGRLGWVPVVQGAGWHGLYQGGYFYTPDYGEPQLVLAVGGKLWRVRTDGDMSVQDLSGAFGLTMDAGQPQYYFAQAEKWLVVQDGSLTTLPLFYSTDDGGGMASLVRSRGFVGAANVLNQIPAAGPMDYFQQRLWYAQGRRYAAGDIVFDQNSGTAGAGYRDSVLACYENPVANGSSGGGDSFITPTASGNIRWLRHAANLDTALGQTNLFIGTRNAIFACNAPIDRSAWIATTLDKMPLQTVALAGAGGYSERSATAINGDLFFASTPNGDVRSLQTSVRYFQQPGQIPLSNNINRVLAVQDRALLHHTSSVLFDNRYLQTVLPYATAVGTAFKGIAALDFNPLSSLQERLPPDWEGVLEGLNVLQLFQANIGGRDRGFAAVLAANGTVELWELSTTEKFDRNDSGQSRVQWSVETPSFAFGNPRQLKELETCKLWVDRIVGTVEFKLEMRPDYGCCFLPWRVWKECASEDCTELFDNPCAESAYPVVLPQFCEFFKTNMTMPKPPTTCIPSSGRSANLAYTFQLRLTVKGFARVRGIFLYAWARDEGPFAGIVC